MVVTLYICYVASPRKINRWLISETSQNIWIIHMQEKDIASILCDFILALSNELKWCPYKWGLNYRFISILIYIFCFCFIYLSLYLSIYLSIDLHVCIYLSIHLSIFLYAHPSVCLSGSILLLTIAFGCNQV